MLTSPLTIWHGNQILTNPWDQMKYFLSHSVFCSWLHCFTKWLIHLVFGRSLTIFLIPFHSMFHWRVYFSLWSFWAQFSLWEPAKLPCIVLSILYHWQTFCCHSKKSQHPIYKLSEDKWASRLRRPGAQAIRSLGKWSGSSEPHIPSPPTLPAGAEEFLN